LFGGKNGQQTGNDRDIYAEGARGIGEFEEVAIVVEKLGDHRVGAGFDFAREVGEVGFHVGCFDVFFRVTGHGDAESNTDFLRGNIALFREVMQQVKADKTKGMTAEQTMEALDKQNTELAAKIGIKDSETAGAFKDYFLNVFVKRAYRELDGPLGDLPDGLPK